MSAASFVLASASPRRREILGMLGFSFDVVPSNVPEAHRDGETPEQYTIRLAKEKSWNVYEHQRRSRIVLGADTVVVAGKELLEKPAGPSEHEQMLTALAGRGHRVVTGMALWAPGFDEPQVESVSTEVRFRNLTPGEIRAYVATGEGDDKAGGYAIQGIGAGLVERIDGSYHNVVGLPAVEVITLLARAGVLGAWAPEQTEQMEHKE